MSKRAGEFITLDDLLAEVGVDAARWFFASRAATTGIDFDIELAKKQSNENPVYYVQYAHARIASIVRKAADAGLAPAATRRGPARRRARGRAGPGHRALPGGRRGRRGARGDAGHHGLRDGARHDLPRLLPRRARRRRRGARALGGRLALARAAQITLANALGAARDLGARVDVGAAAGRRPSPPARATPATRDIVAASFATSTQRTLPPSPGRTLAIPCALASAVVAAVSNSVASAVVSQAVLMATAHAPSGPSMTARRSPPQPAAAASASARRTPLRRSQMPSWSSPNESVIGTVQPDPSRVARSVGRPTSTGPSFAAYFSGWRICSVDSGIRA